MLKMVTEAMLCSTDPSASARCLRRSERTLVASCSEAGIRSRSGWNSAIRRSAPALRVIRLIMRWMTNRSTKRSHDDQQNPGRLHERVVGGVREPAEAGLLVDEGA